MLISPFVYRSQLRENVLHDRSNHRILLCRSPFSQAVDVLSISYVLQQVGSVGIRFGAAIEVVILVARIG